VSFMIKTFFHTLLMPEKTNFLAVHGFSEMEAGHTAYTFQ